MTVGGGMKGFILMIAQPRGSRPGEGAIGVAFQGRNSSVGVWGSRMLCVDLAFVRIVVLEL